MRQTVNKLAESRSALFLKKQLLTLITLAQRYPWVIALYGFVSGVAGFLLVERQAGLASMIAILLLASWLFLVLESAFNQRLARWIGIELPGWMTHFVTQMIHQQSLFFVLPFFAMSTTWQSGQLLFTGLLGLAALISIIDPLYYNWLAPRRWLYLAYHSLTLFAALLTVMPIILHLTTAQSYQLALLITVLLSFPTLAASLHFRRPWRWLALPVLTLALLGIGWLAKPWVPPATLRLNEVAISLQMNDKARAPGRSLQQLSSAELQREGLYAFTAISAPRGLAERIYHVWRRDGKEVDRIALNIAGGRNTGYRAWSHKQNFPNDPTGDWTVEVVTDAGQMIGVLRFTVSP
jgi:hypothetical protein